MSQRVTKLPERLRVVGATTAERQAIEAAGREQPPLELSQRMAASLGISLIVPEPKGQPLPEPSSVTSAATSAGARAALPWIAGGALALAVGGALFGSRPQPESAPQARSSAQPVQTPVRHEAPASSASGDVPAQPQAEALSKVGESRSRSRARTNASADLREQIKLIDAARSAVSAGAGDRALGILRQYQMLYGSGSFGPEASALKVEALVRAGRSSEARALAERFVREYPGTPLAQRVARIAGL